MTATLTLPTGTSSPTESFLTHNLPLEILIHIAKQLPTILDVFALRQTCRTLYNRLGPSCGTVYYHFLNYNGSQRRRFTYYQQDSDYYAMTKSILMGIIPGCGICLRQLRNAPTIAHKGGIFYKSICKPCAKDHFTEIWRLQDEYPTLKIHPNCMITWSGLFPFADPGGMTGRWLPTGYSMYSVSNVDLEAAIKEQLGHIDISNGVVRRKGGKEAWEARFDKQITFAQKRKEGAGVIARIMTEKYRAKYPRLHWLQSPDTFSEYLYNSLLWNLRPYLAPHYNDKSLPNFTLGDKMEDLLDLYNESEELMPELRLKSLTSACEEALAKEFAKIPKPGQYVKKRGSASPLIKYWLNTWLKERGSKCVPQEGNKHLSNRPRICPFCTGAELRLNSTMTLAMHVWCHHPEELESDWAWIEDG